VTDAGQVCENGCRYRHVLESTLLGVWMLDEGHRTTFVNRALTDMLGYRPDQMMGKPAFEFSHPDWREQHRAALQRRQRGDRDQFTLCLRGVDGREVWVLLSGEPLIDDHGRYVGTVGLITDITAYRAGEAERSRLAAIVQASGDAIISLTPEGVIQTWNDGAARLYGYSAEEAIGAHMPSLLATDPAMRDPLIAYGTTRMFSDVEVEDRRKDGSTVELSGSSAPIRDPDGAATGIAVILRDITERRAAEAREREARELLGAITENMAEGMFALDEAGQLIYMNRAAEEMLGWTAQELHGRQMHDLIHYKHEDGTEYPIEQCPMVHVLGGGQTIRMEEDLFIHRDGHGLAVSYSASPLTLGTAHGAVVVFSDITVHKAQAARAAAEQNMLSWVGRIRDALEEDRLVLHAQPIVDLRTGEVAQHELLVRMQDRRGMGRLVSPDNFLPAAEKYGLIGEIDIWVIRQAARLAGRGHRVELNLSAASLADPEIFATIANAFHHAGADPAQVVFELTETTLMRNEQLARAFAQRLSRLGFQLALDDFGMGYGGFNYLTLLPISHIKIDRSFVTNLPANEPHQHILQAIVSLARAFNKKTVAEGVETEQALEIVSAMGIDYAQGYHLGRPAPLSEAFADPDL
jgi:PAS domain S-box-containing protein